MYSVVGSDGQVYGPVDMATLTQWIAEGRVTPETNLIDPLDGRVIQAGQAPALMGNFPNASFQAPPMPGPRPTNPYEMGGGMGPSPYGQNPYGSPLAGYPRNDMMGYYGPPKSKAAAAVLAIFLGGLGIHRFYLGHTGTAIAMLLITVLTCGWGGLITGIWALVDFILILTGGLREANGRPLA